MNNTMANIKLANIPAGRWFKLSYVTDVTLSAAGKKAGVTVLKRVVGTFRIGIDYANTKKVKDKVADGHVLMHKLPWGEYKAGSGNRIICHTNKNGQYNEYARLYSTPNKPRIQHYLNGVPISTENLMKTGYVPKSYFEQKESTGCYTINLNNIESIG